MLMLFYGALAGFGLWRVRHHREGAVVALSLLAALLLAVALPVFVAKPALAAALALVEAVLALFLLGMVVHWRHNCGGKWCTCSLRAMCLGIICLGKIGLWTVYTAAVQDLGQWNFYAAAINGGFVAQALIAGGFGDGMATRIADLWLRIFGRRAPVVARGRGA